MCLLVCTDTCTVPPVFLPNLLLCHRNPIYALIEVLVTTTWFICYVLKETCAVHECDVGALGGQKQRVIKVDTQRKRTNELEAINKLGLWLDRGVQWTTQARISWSSRKLIQISLVSFLWTFLHIISVVNFRVKWTSDQICENLFLVFFIALIWVYSYQATFACLLATSKQIWLDNCRPISRWDQSIVLLVLLK